MSKTSIFKKIADSKAAGAGRPFDPGKYKLTLQKLFIHEGFKGSTFIAELLIRESQATGEVNRAGKTEIPLQAGVTGSFAVNLDNPNAKGSQFANVKRFLLALLGENEDEVTNEAFISTLEDLCGEAGEKAQPLRGAAIELETFKKPKQSNPAEDFTHHRWTHVAQTEAELAAARADLDKTSAAKE